MVICALSAEYKMAGWNLKEGKLINDNISDDEMWSLFCFVFSESCHKTNTYKFGLIKSICDQIYDLSSNTEMFYYLSFDKIFSKFTENYWNLIAKYHLKQMAYNGKSEYSKIEIIIRSALENYDCPSEISFHMIDSKTRNSIIRRVTTECKRCVIGALYNDFNGMLYSFDLRGSGIYLSNSAYRFICKYKSEIERINYYSWAKFLEKVNDDNVLIRLLDKLDMATPKRGDLSIYRDILFNEFQVDTCFYCGKKLNRIVHVDHFIPWSFVKTDNLWNFVLTCPTCNTRKNNRLVNMDFVKLIENRNDYVVSNSKNNSSFVNLEYKDYQSGIITRMWNYAKMNGVQMMI